MHFRVKICMEITSYPELERSREIWRSSPNYYNVLGIIAYVRIITLVRVQLTSVDL